MPKPIPAVESFADLTFPTNGLNVATEFSSPPPLTTPIGINVRAYEPSTMRARGGSRAGLVEFIPAQVSGLNLIQNLDLVVYTSEQAMLTAVDSFGGTAGVADPSTNNNAAGLGPRNPGGPPGPPPYGNWPPFYSAPGGGGGGGGSPPDGLGPRYVRVGGSGIAPTRNIRRPNPNQLFPLTITPNDVAKAFGTGYTFDNLPDEFTVTGLHLGDSVTGATLASAGADSGATAGTYPITASGATGVGLSHYHITYAPGVMTVSSTIAFVKGRWVNGFDRRVPSFQTHPPIALPTEALGPVQAGNLYLLAIAFTLEASTCAVTDTDGNIWSLLGIVTLAGTVRLAVFYTTLQHTGNPQVTFTLNAIVSSSFLGCEFSGVRAGMSAPDQVITSTGAGIAITTAAVGVSGPGELVVGFFASDLTAPVATVGPWLLPTPALNLDTNGGSGPVTVPPPPGPGQPQVPGAYQLNVSVSTAIGGTLFTDPSYATPWPTLVPYAALVASFFHA